MASLVDIFNIALREIGGSSISDPNETNKAARVCRQWYPQARDSVLAKGEFSIAIKRVLLPADAEAPAFGWSRAFTLPSDCARPLLITDTGERGGTPLRIEIEGNQILSNAAAPLKLRYIKRIEDPTFFPPLLEKAIGLQLAVDIVGDLTGRQTETERLMLRARQALSDAIHTDATPGLAHNVAHSNLMAAREEGSKPYGGAYVGDVSSARSGL